MNFAQLPDDWPTHRDELHRVAVHVLANAQSAATSHFALMPTAGGFGTPQYGANRERIRVSGGSLFVERVSGIRDGAIAATLTVASIAGSSIRELCSVAGVEPDPELWIGADAVDLGDPDGTITLDPVTGTILGDWYALGQRAMDEAIASLPDPQAGVTRLWPEHFDLGVDIAVDPIGKPEVRCNLGAAAGDAFHPEPYLYVGPWTSDRPGPTEFWNAPFGATLGFGDLDAADHPLHRAVEFFLTGIAHLRS